MSETPKTYRLGPATNPRTMSPAECAYWAAMIDGEGTIVIARATVKDQNRPQYRMFVGITNTNIELLDRLREMVGIGSLQVSRTGHDKWKDAAQLTLNHEAADFVLRQVRPFLIAKIRQADNAMAFMELKRAWSPSNDNYVEQAALYEANKALNARGKENQTAHELEPTIQRDRRCEYEGCTEKHYGNGYCKKHYKWVYESKTWGERKERTCMSCGSDLPATARIDAKFCSTSCKMKHHRAKGCYAPERLADAPKCSEDGCDRPRQAQGLCRRHYMQRWHAAKKAS